MKINKTNLAIPIILALSVNTAMAAEDGGPCDPTQPLVFHKCDNPKPEYNKAVGDALRELAIGNATGLAELTNVSMRHRRDYTTLYNRFEEVATGELVDGKFEFHIETEKAIIEEAIIGSAQFTRDGNIHINGGSFNVNKTHTQFNGPLFQAQGSEINLISRHIPSEGTPPPSLEEGTGVFLREEFLILQSISKVNGQQTVIRLNDDSLSLGLNDGDDIISSVLMTNEAAGLFHTSDGQLTKSVIAVADKSASMLVTAADGSVHGMMVDDESISLTGGTTKMLLDDNGMTLSGDGGADVQLSGVAMATEGNQAVNLSQLQNVDEKIGEWKDVLDPTWEAIVENPDFGELKIPNEEYNKDDPKSAQFFEDTRKFIPNPVAQVHVASTRDTKIRTAIEGNEDAIGDWYTKPNPKFGKKIPDPEWEAEITNPAFTNAPVDFKNPDYLDENGDEVAGEPRFIVDPSIPKLIANTEDQGLVLEFPSATKTILTDDKGTISQAIGTWKRIPNPKFGKEILDPTWEAEITNPDFTSAPVDFVNPDYLDENGLPVPGELPLIVDPSIPEFIDNPDEQKLVLEFPDATETIPSERTGMREAIETLDTDVTTGELNVNEANIGAGGLTVNASDDGGKTGASMAIKGDRAEVLFTNDKGKTHGLSIDGNSTSLSGGSNSSTVMRLGDNGVTYSRNGAPVQLHGIANGTAPNDAVNYSQLQNFDKKLSGGIAAVTALGMIPDPAPGHRFSLGMGFGNYESESAFAVGLTGRVTNSLSIKAGVGHHSDSTTVGAGLGYSW